MHPTTKKYLHFIPLTKFSLWDVKRYTRKTDLLFSNVAFLNEILIPYKKSVSKDEMITNKWQIISKINFGGKLFLRDFDEIHTYKGSLSLVPDNAIIYSKINVRHGCIYFNEKGDSPFGVSSEYPTYIFDETKVNGSFLHLLLRSDAFKKILNTKTTGISKARVKADEFLNLQIPLPPLVAQTRLVENYNAHLHRAEELEQNANQLEKEIENYLFETLGIEKEEKKLTEKGKLYFVNLKDISRWDVWTTNKQKNTSIFSTVNFCDIIHGKPMYGANVKGVKQKSDIRYVRITDINEDGTLNDDFASPQFFEDKYLLKENDFLIARSGNTVGKTFLYQKSHGKAIFAGYLVKYVLNTEKIYPQYLFHFTKSYSFKKWIDANQRIAGQPNINGQEYLKAPIPLPPLSVQEAIAHHIQGLRAEIKRLRASAEESKTKAIKEFENEIFENTYNDN